MIGLSRLERYRQNRVEKRKYSVVALFFVFIVLSGLCISDYSINAIMNNDYSLSMIKVYKSSDSSIGVNLLDRKLDIDVSFLLNAYSEVRSRLGLR